jgi:hypothetical protein
MNSRLLLKLAKPHIQDGALSLGGCGSNTLQ